MGIGADCSGSERSGCTERVKLSFKTTWHELVAVMCLHTRTRVATSKTFTAARVICVAWQFSNAS